MIRTFYDVLGVSRDASTAEIRAAYRERLKESHPDLSDDEDASATTRRILRARDVLTDEETRERYDRIGHEAFVGRTDASVDDGDVSNAAAAARRTGWANGDTGDGPTNADQTGGRRHARDRRRRERAARERVDASRARNSGTDSDGGGRESSTASPDGGARASRTGGRATASTGNGFANASAAGDGPGGISESSRSWNGSEGFSVRQGYDQSLHRGRLFPSTQSLTLLGIAFLLYPVMLFSALFPPFPLIVNVVVGLCTIFLVGYLQSRPEVAVVVFGTWSLATPIAFAITGVSLWGLAGLAALTGTWLPFGLSLATLAILRV